MKLDTIGFGALNLDKLFFVDKIVEGGGESAIRRYTESAGGSAANTIVGLARLGARVGFIGKISEDSEGRYLLKSLSIENVDVKGISVVKNGKSGIVLGFIDDSGERSLYVDPGVNDTIDITEIDLNYAVNCEYMHLTSFVGEKSFHTQIKVLEESSEVKISLDPGELYVRKGLKALKPIINRSHVIFPNRNELKTLTGKDFKEGSRILLNNGVNIVAVKLGSRGCFVTDGREEHLIDPYEVRVVDSTGAGDAYCAGFLFGLIKNKDLYTCGKIGNFLAASSIKAEGARKGLPKYSDIDNMTIRDIF